MVAPASQFFQSRSSSHVSGVREGVGPPEARSASILCVATMVISSTSHQVTPFYLLHNPFAARTPPGIGRLPLLIPDQFIVSGLEFFIPLGVLGSSLFQLLSLLDVDVCRAHSKDPLNDCLLSFLARVPEVVGLETQRAELGTAPFALDQFLLSLLCTQDKVCAFLCGTSQCTLCSQCSVEGQTFSRPRPRWQSSCGLITWPHPTAGQRTSSESWICFVACWCMQEKSNLCEEGQSTVYMSATTKVSRHIKQSCPMLSCEDIRRKS